ncbi:MAG: glutamine synthetase [Phycisphaerales bacterium]|nr:MAG: glutamine synthetase [Phycisphaerales bacterium]
MRMSPNELVQHLGKPAADFTKDDLMRFCEEREVEMLNLRYVAEDGRLRTLNFAISSPEHLSTILSYGERVDGSNVFSFIEAGSSDLYVVPRYRTAFLNPFTAVPTVDVLCSIYDNMGTPLDSDPGHILHRADAEFTRQTGCILKGMGELEYYVVGDKNGVFPSVDQKGYHASEPFAKFEDIRTEALRLLAKTGAKIKYGHSEVGSFSDGDNYYEQHEIEFLPTSLEEAAEQIILAKWFIRMLCNQRGVEASFAPKITAGRAGSGMHFHMLVESNGRNVTLKNDKLSDTVRKMIAGILEATDALTAFGNTIPTSYLRLVPHQEAPTRICWGEGNRSVAIRVPLGWQGTHKMISSANPRCPAPEPDGNSNQTFEFRVPDGSADIYLTLAGLATAALHGLNMPDARDKARQLHVDVNIFKPDDKEQLTSLEQLPMSCCESADALNTKRAIFEDNGIFPAGLIDSHIAKLKKFDDKGLSERLYGKNDEIRTLVKEFFHIG